MGWTYTRVNMVVIYKTLTPILPELIIILQQEATVKSVSVSVSVRVSVPPLNRMPVNHRVSLRRTVLVPIFPPE